MVGYVGTADGAEQHRGEAAEDLGAVGGHGPAGAQVPFAAPVELDGIQPGAGARRGGAEHGQARRDHLGTHTVTGDHCHAEVLHAELSVR